MTNLGERFHLGTPLAFALTAALPLLLWRFLRWEKEFRPSLKFPHVGLLRGTGGKGRMWRTKIPGLFRVLSLVFLVAAIARPQKVATHAELPAAVTDIMICLDASGSMASEDFQPKNRLTVAKEVAKDFVLGRRFDRIGLVVFGKVPLTQCPLTLDADAVSQALASVQIGTVPQDGTAIGDAISTCINRLKGSAAKSKVVVLVTDGANNAGTVDPETAAKVAATFGIKIYTIGAGVPGQGRLPVEHPILGRRTVPIADDLDEPSLQKIALATGGRYFRATNPQGLSGTFAEINRLEKTEIRVRELSDFTELFRAWAALALICLGLEGVLRLTWARVLP